MASRIIETEAIVLRTIRYGEADRILHLFTPSLGRIGAIAKGVRKPGSRFGGRLEPFFRIDVTLHRGRGDLATVSAVTTIAGHGALRDSAVGLDAAARACDSVSKLFDSEDANPAAYNLLSRYLELLDGQWAVGVGVGPGDPAVALSHSVAFRLKLAYAAGFSPELAACARCGERDHLTGFSGSAGGVVCAGCEHGSFRLQSEAHGFLVDAMARPLSSAPLAPEATLRQADRAVGEVLEHHAHVRLRAAA